MARAYPSVAEIRAAAEEVAEAAAKARGKVELRFAPPGSGQAGSIPDDSSIGGPEFGVGPDGRTLGTAADWAKLKDGYAFIPELFAARVGPEPSEFDPLVTTMEKAWQELYDRDSHADRIGTDIRKVEVHLGSWSGATAEAFRANYLTRIPDAAKNQAQLAFMLQHAALAGQDVYVEARLNLLQLAKDAKKALDALTKSGGAETMVTALTVVGIVASALTLLPAATVACTIIASTVSAAALVAGGAEKPEEADLAGDTVHDVLTSMTDAISQIDSQVYWAERKITDALRANMDVVSDTSHYHGVASNRDGFLPPRPALVGESMSPSTVRSDFVPG